MKRAGFAGLLLLGLLLLACLAPPVADAEVCVVLEQERFQELRIEATPSEGIIWRKVTAVPDRLCLNLNGDLYLDHYPTYEVIHLPDLDPLKSFRTSGPTPSLPPAGELAVPEEEPSIVFTPVVVYSHHDDSDRELMYSFWDYNIDGWAAVKFVERIDNSADDIDPVATVRGNDIVLVWTRIDDDEVTTMTAVGSLQVKYNTADVVWSDPVELEPVSLRPPVVVQPRVRASSR